LWKILDLNEALKYDENEGLLYKRTDVSMTKKSELVKTMLKERYKKESRSTKNFISFKNQRILSEKVSYKCLENGS
jgi:hypothetical protein